LQSSRTGDLSTHSDRLPPSELPSNPFYTFALDEDMKSTVQLPQRLDLGVGDTGIIGRKVSVMAGSINGPTAVAEGIIGWN
jgi:hypothetical protein